MSYDHYVIPAAACSDPATAAAHVHSQLGRSPQPEAAAIAAAITGHNLPLDDQRAFLSIHPLAAEGDMVVVAAPYPRVQDARDVLVAEALRAGYGVFDPQNDVMIDPRSVREGMIESSADGIYRVIAPTAVTALVHRLRDEDYLVVAIAEQRYIQTQRRGDAYALEYRDGSPDRHLGTEVRSAAEVARAMRLWIAGDATQLARLRWTKVDL
ncbi:hypothetical protein [Pseudactinotalea terrae]|uniref:hypothetical protein n=1 Tax=Pseudactinotalea terrae TaxID=1743262 RepID=UPI0012E15B7F|nr:hypothetical protein [Pseudactinotalea terrae]